MVQPFMVDAEPSQRYRGGFTVRIVFVCEPQNSGFHEQVVTFAEQLQPEDERALGHPRVDLVWSIAHADHSRLATRAGAAVSWSIRVQQQDRCPLLPEFISAPGAKHTSPYNSNVIEHENNCNLYECIIRLNLCNLSAVPVEVKDAFAAFDLMCFHRGPGANRQSSQRRAE